MRNSKKKEKRSEWFMSIVKGHTFFSILHKFAIGTKIQSKTLWETLQDVI